MPRCFLAAKLKYPYVKWKEGQEEGSADAPRGDSVAAPILWRLDVPAAAPLDRIQEHHVDVVGREEEVEDEDDEEQIDVEEQEEHREKEEKEEQEEEEEERVWWNRGGVRREGWTKNSMMLAPGP
jgi:hypothetical protein